MTSWSFLYSYAHQAAPPAPGRRPERGKGAPASCRRQASHDVRRLAEELRAKGAAQLRERNDEHCLMRAIKSIELLVPVSYTPCSASTPGLSTWWSSTALKGELVSRWVSRLDAFSSYPFRT